MKILSILYFSLYIVKMEHIILNLISNEISNYFNTNIDKKTIGSNVWNNSHPNFFDLFLLTFEFEIIYLLI